jgi:hypothetical protein
MVRGPDFISTLAPSSRWSMSYESLNCNECGALLQVPTVARYVTCNRCGAHLVVQRTGISTHTESARRPPPERDAPDLAMREMADRMEHLEHQNELMRIDREWEMERERYMVTSRYGRRYVPSMVAAVAMGVISVGFGLVWVFFAFSMASNAGGAFGAVFPLFGLLFIAVGVGTSIYQFSKAQQYQSAYTDYQRRRAAARDRLPE